MTCKKEREMTASGGNPDAVIHNIISSQKKPISRPRDYQTEYFFGHINRSPMVLRQKPITQRCSII